MCIQQVIRQKLEIPIRQINVSIFEKLTNCYRTVSMDGQNFLQFFVNLDLSVFSDKSEIELSLIGLSNIEQLIHPNKS